MHDAKRDEAIKFNLTESSIEGAKEVLKFTALAELILVGFIAAFVEVILFWVLSKKLGNVFLIVVVHVGLVALLCLWIKWRQAHKAGVRIAILLTISTAFLGAFGAVGTFLSVFVYSIFQRSSRTFMEWYKDIFPEDDGEENALYELHHNLVSGRENPEIATSVTSFTDILKRGSSKDKLAAIQVINRNFQPHFAPALKLGLHDSDPMIRVQAASAIASLERKFTNSQQELEELYEKKPKLKNLIALAKHHDQYGNLGVLDDERATENRDKAVAYYKKALQEDPSNKDINFAIGRLLVKLKRYQEAVETFKVLLGQGHVTSEVVGWTIESLFNLKSYDELRDFITQYENKMDNESLHDSVKGFMNLWRTPASELQGE